LLRRLFVLKSFRVLSLLLVVILAGSSVYAADFGVRAGRMNDSDEEFVGAEMAFEAGRVTINPNIEYWLVDDITAGSANLDVTFDIAQFSTVVPYLGAGVGLFYVDSDFGDNTDVVGNLIGGVAFELDFLRPYAQVKYVRAFEDDDGDGGDDLALTIGLRF
jgi:hypothetical protein